MKGHSKSFWGDGAALLLVCPGDGLPEPRAQRPRIIRCLLPQNKGVSFSLAGNLGACMGGMLPLTHPWHCWPGEEVRGRQFCY